MLAAVRKRARMPWRPVNPTHAIERVRFLVQFRQPISEKLNEQLKRAAGRHSNETRMVGPAPMQSVRFGIQVLPDGQQQVLSPVTEGHGWQYVRSSSVNQPLEVLGVQGNQIVYETTEYRRWNTFVQRFSKVAAEAIEVANQSLDTEIVALEYFDRFYFEGDREDADPRLLLSDIEKFLKPDAASGRTMWHLHRGWFEKATGGDILINQNFDVTEAIPPGGTSPVRTISIFTKAELRSSNHVVDGVPMADLLNLLHDSTGSYFKSALEPSMLASVGMYEDEKA